MLVAGFVAGCRWFGAFRRSFEDPEDEAADS